MWEAQEITVTGDQPTALGSPTPGPLPGPLSGRREVEAMCLSSGWGSREVGAAAGTEPWCQPRQLGPSPSSADTPPLLNLERPPVAFGKLPPAPEFPRPPRNPHFGVYLTQCLDWAPRRQKCRQALRNGSSAGEEGGKGDTPAGSIPPPSRSRAPGGQVLGHVTASALRAGSHLPHSLGTSRAPGAAPAPGESRPHLGWELSQGRPQPQGLNQRGVGVVGTRGAPTAIVP